MIWTECEDGEELARLLAASIADDLIEAVARDGRAAIAVSGGSTPVRLFEALSTSTVPFHSVVVALVDERWTSVERDRNETLVRERLLKNAAAEASFLAPWDFRDQGLRAAVDRLERIGREDKIIPPGRPFDVTVLGMGTDGHTASLFPDAKQLKHAVITSHSWAQLLPMRAPLPRLSMTVSAIRASQRVILHIEGAEKREVLEAALAVPEEAVKLPIRLVADVCPQLEVWWSP